jgi:hypothetical protein
MTGSHDDDVGAQCRELGCVAFLPKPISEGVLMRAVATAIGPTIKREP